jgi:hypothetical protein
VERGDPLTLAQIEMAGNLTSNRVLSGPYAGLTKAEMQTEWERYKTALLSSGSRLGGATVNGQNFQFGPRSDWTLSQWGRTIRHALAQVDPDWMAPEGTIFTRFSTEGSE